MRLIGATNFMIRAPFVVQGVMIGLVGALIPLAITYFLYRQAVVYMMERFDILSNLIEFIPIQTIFPSMVAVALSHSHPPVPANPHDNRLPLQRGTKQRVPDKYYLQCATESNAAHRGVRQVRRHL